MLSLIYRYYDFPYLVAQLDHFFHLGLVFQNSCLGLGQLHTFLPANNHTNNQQPPTSISTSISTHVSHTPGDVELVRHLQSLHF
jgi:hypothetical protein